MLTAFHTYLGMRSSILAVIVLTACGPAPKPRSSQMMLTVDGIETLLLPSLREVEFGMHAGHGPEGLAASEGFHANFAPTSETGFASVYFGVEWELPLDYKPGEYLISEPGGVLHLTVVDATQPRGVRDFEAYGSPVSFTKIEALFGALAFTGSFPHTRLLVEKRMPRCGRYI